MKEPKYLTLWKDGRLIFLKREDFERRSIWRGIWRRLKRLIKRQEVWYEKEKQEICQLWEVY